LGFFLKKKYHQYFSIKSKRWGVKKEERKMDPTMPEGFEELKETLEEEANRKRNKLESELIELSKKYDNVIDETKQKEILTELEIKNLELLLIDEEMDLEKKYGELFFVTEEHDTKKIDEEYSNIKEKIYESKKKIRILKDGTKTKKNVEFFQNKVGNVINQFKEVSDQYDELKDKGDKIPQSIQQLLDESENAKKMIERIGNIQKAEKIIMTNRNIYLENITELGSIVSKLETMNLHLGTISSIYEGDKQVLYGLSKNISDFVFATQQTITFFEEQLERHFNIENYDPNIFQKKYSEQEEVLLKVQDEFKDLKTDYDTKIHRWTQNATQRGNVDSGKIKKYSKLPSNVLYYTLLGYKNFPYSIGKVGYDAQLEKIVFKEFNGLYKIFRPKLEEYLNDPSKSYLFTDLTKAKFKKVEKKVETKETPDVEFESNGRFTRGRTLIEIKRYSDDDVEMEDEPERGINTEEEEIEIEDYPDSD